MILLDVHVVNRKYLERLEDQKCLSVILGEVRHLSVKYPKRIRITMVRKTIHVTKEQAKWVEGNALNLSKYVRKLIDTDMAKWNEITEKVLHQSSV